MERYMSNLNVMHIGGDLAACHRYRAKDPFMAMHKSGINVKFFNPVGKPMQTHMKVSKGVNLILIQRLTHPSLVPFMQKVKETTGAKLVYEQDDNLRDLDPSNPAYDYFREKDVRKAIEATYEMSDAVICSTHPLAEQIGTFYKKPIYVVPNLIDVTVFKPTPDDAPEKKQKNGRLSIGWGGGDCVDSKTEILTKDGYKFFEELTSEDLVATLNAKGKLEYQKPTRIIKEDYIGKMHLYSSKHVDYCITPNHRFYGSKPTNPHTSKENIEFEFIRMNNAPKKMFAKKNAKWEGSEVDEFVIPNTNISIKMDDWLAFFGFWIAEGWTTSSKCLDYSGRERELMQVGISQKDTSVLDKIDSIMSKYGFDPKRTKDNMQSRIFNEELWQYLSSFGKAKNKYFPNEFLSLNKRQLRILLDWYILGDGNIDSSGRIRAYTTSKKLADQLSEIALKLGWAANISKRDREPKNWNTSYVVSFLQDKDINYLQPLINRTKFEEEIDYNGKIYCVEVPNHTWYMRRNGKSIWTGNSHLRDIREIWPTLMYFLEYYPNVDIHFVGYLPTFVNEIDLKRIQRTDWATLDVYTRAIASFDIALAPLLENKFNEAKSDIKVLESGAVKVPAIASDYHPYTEYLDNETFPVCRKDRDWFKWIKRLIESEDLRKKYAQKQYDYVHKNRNLWINVDERIKIYEEITGIKEDWSKLEFSVPDDVYDDWPPEEYQIMDPNSPVLKQKGADQ